MPKGKSLVSIGVLKIANERSRQILSEGWDALHDKNHAHGEMATAAAVYALISSGTRNNNDPDSLAFWPTEWKSFFKPKDKIRNLERAGALIAAEIDRLLGCDPEA